MDVVQPQRLSSNTLFLRVPLTKPQINNRLHALGSQLIEVARRRLTAAIQLGCYSLISYFPWYFLVGGQRRATANKPYEQRCHAHSLEIILGLKKHPAESPKSGTDRGHPIGWRRGCQGARRDKLV